ncbi:MAG: histidine kinase [Candidatus Pseudobacter hemicellulosilyticus]|uniref:Histidine kinase n=1 Tax=Candidatus Pseudobacter hemicellulosilyticus TaxID=3121375 RepID=A0AAJ5WQE5_9BACT|nr:MAG: histidine kinase [Pseudobacter sp.]
MTSLKTKLLFIGFWLVWTAMHMAIFLQWDFEWTVALADALVTNLVLLLICLVVSINLRFYRPHRIYVLSLCGGFSWLGVLFIKYLLQHFLPNAGDDYRYLMDNSLGVRFTVAFLFSGGAALLSELFYALQDKQQQQKRKDEAEKLARNAELFQLRQQLQPHFLFNSLNSISALTGSQPAQARKMIQQLSDFLRGTLKREEQQWISLDEELQHLQLYLDIEKVRFGHRLSTELQQDPNTGKLQIPHMLLQPVMENAIKFGLYDTIGDIIIRLHATLEPGYLLLSIQNPYDPETASPKHGTGFGLHSTKRRLYLLYGRNDLVITHAANAVFTTTIKIPQT